MSDAHIKPRDVLASKTPQESAHPWRSSATPLPASSPEFVEQLDAQAVRTEASDMHLQMNGAFWVCELRRVRLLQPPVGGHAPPAKPQPDRGNAVAPR